MSISRLQHPVQGCRGPQAGLVPAQQLIAASSGAHWERQQGVAPITHRPAWSMGQALDCPSALATVALKEQPVDVNMLPLRIQILTLLFKD